MAAYIIVTWNENGFPRICEEFCENKRSKAVEALQCVEKTHVEAFKKGEVPQRQVYRLYEEIRVV